MQDRDSTQRVGDSLGGEASPASQPQPLPQAHQQQPRQKRRLLPEADDACSVPDASDMGPGVKPAKLCGVSPAHAQPIGVPYWQPRQRA